MTTNPTAINVLCYGDSNTWGQKPDKSGRHAVGVRWTSLLQEALGNEYYIIEEGLSSRTTDLEYSKKPGRNGKTYLVPCIGSHNPLDVVMVMLGTNDLKTEFNRSAADIAQALKGLVSDIREYAYNGSKQPPKVLLVSTIFINENAPDFANYYTGIYDAESARKSEHMAAAVQAVATELECAFFDAATVAQPGSDGIHIAAEGHAALAKGFEPHIRQLAK